MLTAKRATTELVFCLTLGFLARSSFLAWVIVLLFSLNTSARSQGTTPASPYAYNGGSFSLTVSFKMYTSYEFDGGAGGDLGNPGLVVIANLDTGKSESFPYLQSLQLPKAGAGSSGNRTISGTLSVNADQLGAGPLTFDVKGVSVEDRTGIAAKAVAP